MDSKSGSLIDSLFLFSDQCPVLLRQALEREEAEGEQAATLNQSRPTQAGSSESEGEEPGGSSSSEEEEEEEEDPEETNNDEPAKAAKSNAAKPPKKKPPPKPTQTEQQRQHTVKKHVENLVCDTLPVNDTEALHLPTSLLSKPQDSSIAERNYVSQSACQEYLALSESLQSNNNILVILLRSGRFAAGIFQGPRCLVHSAKQRYTVRKGQGKAQSTQDGKGRPKSMGAQLRRAGEEALQQDIRDTMEEWNTQGLLAESALILLSCPKAMKKYLFDALLGIDKNDPRLRRLPLDIGRPTFENVCIAHQVMMTVQLKQWVAVGPKDGEEDTAAESTNKQQPAVTPATASKEAPEQIIFPLTPLHEACQKGDLEAITSYLSNPQQVVSCLDQHGQTVELTVETLLQRRVGPDFMTCLHYAAAAVEPYAAAACVTQLLLQGRADPAKADARSRVPYFVASHDKVRDAFRLARGTLGEDFCKWETVAKVGPPLTEADLHARKEREAEKKRKKRARQKHKKAQEKAEAQAEQQQQAAAEEDRQKEEAAKRVRDGLAPKQAAAGGSLCDFCQTVVKGRKRKDMFSRLEYVYCSADCVQKHKRELMAAAALSRFGG